MFGYVIIDDVNCRILYGLIWASWVTIVSGNKFENFPFLGLMSLIILYVVSSSWHSFCRPVLVTGCELSGA